MAKYSWESPYDESNGDLPVDDAIHALIRFRDGEELTLDESGLVTAAFDCRPDLLRESGIDEMEQLKYAGAIEELKHAA